MKEKIDTGKGESHQLFCDITEIDIRFFLSQKRWDLRTCHFIIGYLSFV